MFFMLQRRPLPVKIFYLALFQTGLDDQRLAEIIIGNDNIHEKVIPQEQK